MSRRDRVAAIRTALASLEQVPGCLVQVDEPHSLLTRLVYLIDDVFVEIVIDWRDLHAACYVGVSANGMPAPGYLLDEERRRVRYRLSDVLPKAPLRLTPWQRHKRTTEEYVREQLARMDEMVGLYAAAIIPFDAVQAATRARFAEGDADHMRPRTGHTRVLP